MKFLLSSLLFCVSAFAQSATPIRCPAGMAANCWMMEAQSVPTSPTVIETSGFTVLGGWVSCTGTQTITLTDGNGVALIPTIAWAGPQTISLNLFVGSYVSGGISISASAAGCKYHLRYTK